MERTVALTDAVVAIAITLLVLPLVELAPDVDPDDLSALLDEHFGVLISFVLSFLVIYQFWAAHERVFARITRAVPLLRPLNMLWMLGIAFLPFPTALVGEQTTTSTVPLYIGAMLGLSIVTTGMSIVAMRAWAGGTDHRRRIVAVATTCVFLGCFLASFVAPTAALVGLSLTGIVTRIGPRWAPAR